MATKTLSPAERRKKAALEAKKNGEEKSSTSKAKKKGTAPSESRKKSIAQHKQTSADKKKKTPTKKRVKTTRPKPAIDRKTITVAKVLAKDESADKKKSTPFIQDGQEVRVMRKGANPGSRLNYKLMECGDCESLVAFAKSKKSGRWYLCQVQGTELDDDTILIEAMPWHPHFKFCGTDEIPDEVTAEAALNDETPITDK